MKILISPDSYKGTLTSVEAAKLMAQVVKEVFPDSEIQLKPMADGGAGTLEALSFSVAGEWISCQAHTPMGDSIQTSYYGISSSHKNSSDSEAVIEMAKASGLLQIPPDKVNPLKAYTYGTGEMIVHALDQGYPKISLTLGGSGTNDGGVGMALALGYRFLDKKGEPLFHPPILDLRKLVHLHSIREDKKHVKIEKTRFYCITDVNNPLLGPKGATAVYGPQKGVTPEMAPILEAGLAQLSRVIERDLGLDIRDIPGSGAAGGLGGGSVAFLNATILPGASWMAEKINLPQAILWADLIITGEGRIDGQTLFGKTISHVLQLAKKYDKKVIALGGSLGEGYEKLAKEITLLDASQGKSYSWEELKLKGKELLLNTLKEYLVSYQKGAKG